MTKKKIDAAGFCITCGLRKGIHKVANDSLKRIEELEKEIEDATTINADLAKQNERIEREGNKLNGENQQLRKEFKELSESKSL